MERTRISVELEPGSTDLAIGGDCSFQAAIGSTSHPGDVRWKAGDLASVLDRQLEAWGSGPGDRLASSVGIDRSEAGFRREVRRVGDHGERVSVGIQLGR